MKEKGSNRFAEVGEWFQTICFVSIPVFGFFYLLICLLRKKVPREKKNFLLAFLLYQILVLIIAAAVLFAIYQTGLDFVDAILKYAGN